MIRQHLSVHGLTPLAQSDLVLLLTCLTIGVVPSTWVWGTSSPDLGSGKPSFLQASQQPVLCTEPGLSSATYCGHCPLQGAGVSAWAPSSAAVPQISSVTTRMGPTSFSITRAMAPSWTQLPALVSVAAAPCPQLPGPIGPLGCPRPL